VLPEQFVRGSLLSSFSTEELLVYMCTNRSSYGMKKCSETEVCLTMNIEEKDFSGEFVRTKLIRKVFYTWKSDLPFQNMHSYFLSYVT